MAHPLSASDVHRYNTAYQRGCQLVEGQLLLHDDRPRGRPGFFARRRLRKAIASFDEALRIVPHSWQALWLQGKVHQRLGESTRSLDCFGRAHSIAPGEPDVGREACLAAIATGDGEAAVRFAHSATAAAPDDAGLVCNLALAQLVQGDVPGAAATIAQALAHDPQDPVAARVKELVDAVVSGKRPRPRNGAEL